MVCKTTHRQLKNEQQEKHKNSGELKCFGWVNSSCSTSGIRHITLEGPTWSWSYGSSIYNYLRNQCSSPLKLWDRTFMARCTLYNITWESFSDIWGRSVVFTEYSGFLHQYNWPPRNSWNIVESGVKTS
jgi:hypothetical protein